MELNWTPEQEKLFAHIQDTENVSRIQSIRIYKWRSRKGTYEPPSKELLDATRGLILSDEEQLRIF